MVGYCLLAFNRCGRCRIYCFNPLWHSAGSPWLSLASPGSSSEQFWWEFSPRAGTAGRGRARSLAAPAARLIYDDLQIGSKEIAHIFCDLTSMKNWLSELVHLTCYRICARGLSATIHYHNRSVPAQRVHITVTHTQGLANKG